MMSNTKSDQLNFIEELIEKDLSSGKLENGLVTRFPPHPNGYLHIGHAKSICLNFGLAKKYGGKCNLRFDDTNPEKEDIEYIESIKKDIQWLGFEWGETEFYASDYFDTLYEYAIFLIKQGDAYVDTQSAKEISNTRGTPSIPGTESPTRSANIDKNLALFEKMKKGEFKEGEAVLRAKIDMSNPNMQLRDPVLYRIKNLEHHRTGNKWVIYPTYDFAHGQSDSIEKVTHSLCTLEFEVHRPLYNWLIDRLNIFPSKQTEFARLNLNYTVTSKTKLNRLVEEGFVKDWDDPRMPTISGLRRRGYTPESIRDFCDKAGIARREATHDMGLLEHSVRNHLNLISKRVFAIFDPVKLIITNYPEGDMEEMIAPMNPENMEVGNRIIPFTRELVIEREDFMIDPPNKFYRLGPDRVVRLKYGYVVKCLDYSLDSSGQVKEIICEYYPDSKSGEDNSGIKVKSAIHWLSINYSMNIQVNLYDRLFAEEKPDGQKDVDFTKFVNPNSLEVRKVLMETIDEPKTGDHFQFERNGYYVVDQDRFNDMPVFNRTVPLRDHWASLKK